MDGCQDSAQRSALRYILGVLLIAVVAFAVGYRLHLIEDQRVAKVRRDLRTIEDAYRYVKSTESTLIVTVAPSADQVLSWIHALPPDEAWAIVSASQGRSSVVVSTGAGYDCRRIDQSVRPSGQVNGRWFYAPRPAGRPRAETTSGAGPH